MTMLDSEGRIKPLVDRLRQAAQEGREIIEPWDHDPNLYDEAANEIARLRELVFVIDKRDRERNLFDCPSGGWIRQQIYNTFQQ